jgi:hypothetical protein
VGLLVFLPNLPYTTQLRINCPPGGGFIIENE